MQLTGDSTNMPDVVRTGAASALAAWRTGSSAYARRTADGGRTWSPRTALASDLVLYPSVSGGGSGIDLAYVQQVRCPTDGGTARRLFYRRSMNGGATWGAAQAMTSSCSQIADQDVARDASGQVSVVWTGFYSGQIFMRTSTDGGRTFGPPRLVGRTDNSEPGPRAIYRSDPALAVGDGVIYLAYTAGPDVLAVRQSRDRGASWSSAVRFAASTGPSSASLVAVGSQAVLGYAISSSSGTRGVYRRTANRGATWSSPRPLLPVGSGEFSDTPRLTYQRGLLAAVLKHGRPGDSPVWHVQSTDFGTTWSAPTRVSVPHTDRPDAEAGGVAVLDVGRLAVYLEPLAGGLWARRTVR
ncbi:MAG: exo-alpha-sialidase [Chloroflexota bacterium]|nr:exo-alpha-sialidase [Chloroflexota bacterium]